MIGHLKTHYKRSRHFVKYFFDEMTFDEIFRVWIICVRRLQSFGDRFAIVCDSFAIVCDRFCSFSKFCGCFSYQIAGQRNGKLLSLACSFYQSFIAITQLKDDRNTIAKRSHHNRKTIARKNYERKITFLKF